MSSITIHGKRRYVHDPITDAIMTISEEHTEIHEGEMFDAHLLQIGKADGDFTRIQINTAPASSKKFCHLFVASSSEGAAYTRLYEGAAGSSAASAISTINHNRTSNNVASTVCSAITGISGGTLIMELYHGSSGIIFASPGESRARNEYILSADTSYVVEMESDAASNVLSLDLHFYETALSGGEG